MFKLRTRMVSCKPFNDWNLTSQDALWESSYSTPDGNSKDQVAILHATAEDWSKKIHTGRLPQAEAWIALIQGS